MKKKDIMVLTLQLNFLLWMCYVPCQGQSFLKKKVKSMTSKKAEIDFDSEKFSAAPLMSSLLSTNGVRLTFDGKLTTEDLSVAFLPAKYKNGEQVKYDQYKKEDLQLTSRVIRSDGEEMGTFHYSVNPVVRLGSRLTQKRGNDYSDFIQLEEGEYTLQFYNADHHYYTFPFSVVKKEADDPYAAVSEAYFLKGPWEDWNYFYFSPSTGGFVWNHYMDNTTMDIENEFRVEKLKTYGVKYELYKDGKLFGVHDSRRNGTKKMTINDPKDYVDEDAKRTRWSENNTEIAAMPGPRKDFWDNLKKDDFTDGNYKMIVFLRNCVGKEWKNEFPFAVKGGKFMGAEEQNRSKHKDPLSLVEGGRDQVWVKRISN